jgi:hypothetical protein
VKNPDPSREKGILQDSGVFTVTKLRLLLVLAIAAVYLIAWRPVRGMIAQHLVYPAVEQTVTDRPDEWLAGPVSRSVTFTIYRITEENGETGYAAFVFSTPWGFYLVLPLLGFLFIQGCIPYVKFHIWFQLGAGLAAVALFIVSINYAPALIHLYRLITYYAVPGLAFLVVFAAVFQNKIVLHQPRGQRP